MARFVVDTGDIDISKEDQVLLQQGMQQLVLSHVARLGFDKPFAVKFPREWYGIILHPELDRLRDIEMDIGKRIGF